MNHNIVVIDGKEYQAVKEREDMFCCFGCRLDDHCFDVHCETEERVDDVSVIYKRRYTPTNEQLKEYATINGES